MLLLLLLGCANAFAQQYAVKKDGSKIPLYSFHVNESKKRLDYKVNSLENNIAFADIDSIVNDKKVLKRFDLSKKPRLLYVIASSKGKTLATANHAVSRYRGGFESTIKQYEVLLIENGKVVESVKCTASKSKEEADNRAEVFRIASANFMDCNPLMERLALLEGPEDSDNLILLNYLDNPERLHCKP